MENIMEVTQKLKNCSYHIIHQYYFWVYIQKDWNQDL